MSSKPRFAAHSPPKDQPEKWQTMREHTLGENGKTPGVLPLAVQFAIGFQAGEWAKLAALLHDIGKYGDKFQNYLDACHQASLKGKTYRVPGGGGDHKRAGASLTEKFTGLEYLDPIFVSVLGHHGGMPDHSDAITRAPETGEEAHWKECIERARQDMPELVALTEPLTIPASFGKTEREQEMFARMLFSCLVDADSLDTEQHFQAEKTETRQWEASLDKWERVLEANQQTLQNEAAQNAITELEITVNTVRREVYESCLQAAGLPPGVFKLTVPTGGGKTRASLAFALAHIRHHTPQFQRIIYAIPYTSIIDQTVGVFQGIFGEDAPILVHHSAVPDEPKDRDDEDTGDGESSWRRLASENWDAPLVVTTTVQLFESLFANKPSACRKLHNIAQSVLILDEVQMLPPHLLKPIIDALKTLAKYYGVTVILCTATQPALSGKLGYLSGFNDVREIVPEPELHFQKMRRVQYHIEPEPLDWKQVAQKMSAYEPRQCVTVVNTRADALKLLSALREQIGNDNPAIFHLSTLLCGAHRRQTMDTIRTRLKAGEECLLVSTQVVEAGVDLDFPYAMRAIAGFERIIQLAGRCNRSGKLTQGEVTIFQPKDERLPPDVYKTATARTKIMLQNGTPDFDDPTVCTGYFAQVYKDTELDAHGIQKMRRSWDFPEVAKCFRMIDSPTRPVLVEYAPEQERYECIKAALSQGHFTRAMWREAQSILVNLFVTDIQRLIQKGDISDTLPRHPDTLYKWNGNYDEVEGMVGVLKDSSEPYDPNKYIF